MEYVFYYKIITVLTGLLIVFMGYLLFIKGVFKESGDFTGSFKDTKVILKKAAPGTYFVLFGSLIIMLGIYKGYSKDELVTTKSNPALQHIIPPTIPDSLKIK